ncbi:MAG TPA: DUF368 domain-containing protein [Bacteroidales bacterium]|nr:DUF368 domain-containing protein [Bacteroidales bacterium]
MKESVKNAFLYGIKGMAMGAANVIPGVSGGTIALITGIFERLINAIKSFNLTALKLLLKGRFREFVKHVDLFFLTFVLLGIAVAIISIARLFEFLFENHPIYIWAFFFGLVLASVYFVARRIEKWNWAVILNFLIGTAVAVSISVLTPASGSDAVWYVALCGVVAACSMILPGLSGSFVLILMGNYQLIMIDAVNNLDLGILIPTVVGAAIGILAFSWILSWVFKKFRNQTIALLSGFILGSLGILWPWKHEIIKPFDGVMKTVGYDWYLPEINAGFFIAAGLMIAGIASIWAMEYAAREKEKP